MGGAAVDSACFDEPLEDPPSLLPLPFLKQASSYADARMHAHSTPFPVQTMPNFI